MSSRSSSNGCYGGLGRAASFRGLDRGAPPENIRSPNFHFTDVPADTIYKLKSSYSLLKKSENVRQLILAVLESSENPYAVALQIVTECEDLFHNKANTLAAFVIEEFCAWAKGREHLIQHNLTQKLKYDAFCLITMQRNSSLIKSVIVTFKMSDDSMIFIDKIRDFIALKRYKEALQCAVALGILNQFSIDQIILPLILQDKLSIAEEGLAVNPHLQVELVTRLDQLVGERSLRNTVDHLVNQLEVPDVKLDRFISHKPLGKLISKLVKTFNLPPETTPNLNQKRSAGALNFIFHKRFFEKSLSIDSWKEMAYDAVKDNYTLQQELVAMLAGYNEVDESLYWALEFQIPQHKWPHNVSLLFKEDPLAKREFPVLEQTREENEDWGDTSDYHALALPDSAIMMVDSEQLLKECIDYISKHECKVVGIDSEWKPAFGGQQNELALIQLATWDRIFILDVIKMANISPNAWHKASNVFFENAAITKLGFSLGSDMMMIRSSIPPLANLKINGTGYLDLSALWRRLQSKGLTYPFSGDNVTSSGESLSKLVSLCLGKALNKSDQFSNWEQRPLRTGQMRYAALDAFVLLELHRKIEKLANEQGLPFLEVCDEIIMGYRTKSAPVPSGYHRRGRGRGRSSKGPNLNPGQGSSQGQGDGASSLGCPRFTVDHTLSALGRQLRKCGVDCTVLERALRGRAVGEVEAALKAIADEDRVVLSTGVNAEWFEANLPPDAVYRVRAGTPGEQLKEVLRHFGIVVTDADVLSRCMKCNSNVFDRVSQEMMLELAGIPQDADADAALASGGGSDLADAMAQPAISEDVRKWVLSADCSSVAKGLTLLGAEIQFDKVPRGVLQNVRVFYLCSQCGKVYWDGSHVGRAVERCKASGVIAEPAAEGSM